MKLRISLLSHAYMQSTNNCYKQTRDRKSTEKDNSSINFLCIEFFCILYSFVLYSFVFYIPLYFIPLYYIPFVLYTFVLYTISIYPCLFNRCAVENSVIRFRSKLCFVINFSAPEYQS